MVDDVLLMYGCPITDWKPMEDIKPIEIPITTDETPIKDIKYFKEKFMELFTELESVMGNCKRVSVTRDDKINVEINF